MYRIGIDLGGTNIVAGVVSPEFAIVGKASAKTKAGRSAEEILEDMARVAEEAVANAGLTMAQVEAVGVGTPGVVDTQNGVVVYSNNLGFFDLPMAKPLTERLQKPCFLQNDANAAAVGEYLAGAGKGTENFVMITLGTGVGGGLIFGGKVYAGSNGAGAELGHTVIVADGAPCTCGRHGCFEAYASATALIRMTKQAMTRYPDSKMWTLCHGTIDAVNGRTAFEAMRAGDSAGRSVVEEYQRSLAVGLSNLINIFQPDVLAVGGGISGEGEALLGGVREQVRGENYARNLTRQTELKIAALGNDAGIIGAAYSDRC